MIRIYEQGYNDFSSNGLGQLHPTRCVVREQQGGVYDLEIDHPMDETLAYDFLKNGRIIKVPVPAATTPMHKIKGVENEEWWKADVDGKAVYSVKSTDVGYSQTVTKTKTVLTEKVLPRAAAAASMDMEYMGNHPRDTGVIYEKKPVTYTESEWVPGSSRVVDRVRKDQLFLVLDKTDSSWWQVTTSRGQTGWMQTGGISHDHTVVGRLDETVQEKKIRDQLFRIYKTEKDTDAGEVRAWARHIYYDLLGNVVMEGVYEEVTLGDLLPQLEANCSQPDHGFSFYTDAPETVLTELDYTHKNMVEAQLDPDDGVLAKGNLRMVRDNFDVYFTGRSQTKRAPITYGRNLLGVTLEIDEDGVVNRIVPIGSNKDGDPVLLDQKWVDSPNLAEGDLIRAKAIEYSEAREKDAREATENSPSEPAVTIADVKEMLLEKANEEYDKGIDLPDIELTVDFIQLGDTDEYQQFRELDRVYLSDLVQITDLVHGLDVEAEVTEYEYDCLTERYISIKVGVTSAGRTIGSLDGFLLPNGGVGGTKLARGGVDASRLQNLSITSAKIGVAQIQQAHIQDAAIDTAQIKNAAITTAKIGDAQVDTAQIKDAAIQTAKIGDLQVSNAKIANGTIETAKIKDAAITTAKIQDAQITNAKIAAAGIDFANIKDVVAGTGIFRQGVGDALYLDRLVVNDANFASAIAGKLMIRDTDGKLYRISVNSSGAVTATQVQVNGDSLTDNAVMSVSQRLLWRQATQPSAPWVGMLWLDTTTEKLKRCTAITPSVAWEVVPAGEVHTAVIDVDDNGMNVLSGGNLNLLAGGNLNIKNLGNTANVINMDNTGLTISSTGQLNLQSTDSIRIGGSPFGVGGTNLLPNTSASYSNKVYSNVSFTSIGGDTLTALGLKPGDTVTLRAYLKLTSAPAAGMRIYAMENNGTTNIAWNYGNTVAASSEGYSTTTFTINPATVSMSIMFATANGALITSTQQYKWQKLERGTQATDWSPAPQDTVDALTGIGTQISGLQTQVDGKIETYFGPDNPSSGWTTAQKAAAVGDMWFNSSSGAAKLKRWNGSAWQDINDQTAIDAYSTASTAQTTANSKINTFVGSGTPSALAAGDLWLDTGNKNIWKRATAAGSGGWVQYLTASGYVNSTGITIDGTDLTVKATGNLNLAANGNLNVQNDGSLNVLNGGDIIVESGGKINLTSADDIVITGGKTISMAVSDSIQVGGKNYVRDAGKEYTVLTYNTDVNPGGYSIDPQLVVDAKGKQIVVSFDFWYATWLQNSERRQVHILCKKTDNTTIYLVASVPKGYSVANADNNTFQRWSQVINFPSDVVSIDSCYYYVNVLNYTIFKNLKIEVANKATAFSYHPDDPASGVKTSYIDIATDHIDIASSGNVSIAAGANFNVRAGAGKTNIGISNNAADNYFMWAGHGTPASAPFSVKMDGSVKATKIQHEMPYTFWDMADSSTPAEFPVYIPSGYTIDSVAFTFQTKKARTFAKSAASGGSGTATSGLPSDLYTFGPKDSTTTSGSSAENTGGKGANVSGFSGSVGTGSAGNSAHTHGSGSYSAASHYHSMAHTHTFAHQHQMADHTHSVGIPGHTHGLDYGINEKTALATSCVLKIGAATIGTYSPNPSAPVEIKANMVAGWNTITVAPNNDARIVAYAMVKLTPA